MFSFLKCHPFSVEAFFENSIVLTFAVAKEELQGLIPRHLKLDLFRDKWAFIAVALVETSELRPKGFPKILGNHFFLIGYRIFVRYRNREGRNLRGLYILKSETDSLKMKILGGIFTHYNYSLIHIYKRLENSMSEISSSSGLNIQVNWIENAPSLPESSPFSTWKEARLFSGPLPFTFTCNEIKNEVLIVEGIRESWKPKPLKIESYKIPFLDTFKFHEINFANAFVVRNIPYHWKKGRIEKWNQ